MSSAKQGLPFSAGGLLFPVISEGCAGESEIASRTGCEKWSCEEVEGTERGLEFNTLGRHWRLVSEHALQDWMKVEVWNELVAYWCTPEWQKKSHAARTNRMTEKFGSITKHAGGSIKFEVHEERLVQKYKRPLNDVELFRATHTKKGSDGVLMDGKSQRIDGAYTAALIENYGSNSTSQPDFDMEQWIEVSSGASKGRVYGLGSSKCIGASSSASYSCSSVHAGPSSRNIMTQEQVE